MTHTNRQPLAIFDIGTAACAACGVGPILRRVSRGWARPSSVAL